MNTPKAIQLNEEQREAIAWKRDKIAAALQAYQQARQKAEAAAAKLADLELEADMLEARLDVTDAAALQAYQQARDTRKIVAAHVPQLEAAAKAAKREVTNYLMPCRNFIRELFQPEVARLVGEIAGLLCPFYREEAAAVAAARATDQVQAFTRYISRPWDISDVERSATELFTIFDSLAQGVNPWSFSGAAAPKS